MFLQKPWVVGVDADGLWMRRLEGAGRCYERGHCDLRICAASGAIDRFGRGTRPMALDPYGACAAECQDASEWPTLSLCDPWSIAWPCLGASWRHVAWGLCAWRVSRRNEAHRDQCDDPPARRRHGTWRRACSQHARQNRRRGPRRRGSGSGHTMTGLSRRAKRHELRRPGMYSRSSDLFPWSQSTLCHPAK